mgnify:CR=1 FL=1
MEIKEKIEERNEDKIHDKSLELLKSLNINLNDPNFKDSPGRISNWLEEFTNPYNEKDAVKHLRRTFPTISDAMECVGPVTVKMLCPHHFLPAIIKVWLIFIPEQEGERKVVGLSKIPRFLVELGKFPQLQEDYAAKARNLFMKHVRPHACLIYTVGLHTCMFFRGIEDPQTIVKISSASERFRDDRELEMRAYQMIRSGEIRLV